MAGSFDGNWNVLIACAGTNEGIKSYNWQFPATIKNGVVHGQYKTPGVAPSGTLTGQVRDDGTGSLRVQGITGDPDYSVKRVNGGLPFHYTARAHFSGQSGTAERVELRSCNLSFSRS